MGKGTVKARITMRAVCDCPLVGLTRSTHRCGLMVTPLYGEGMLWERVVVWRCQACYKCEGNVRLPPSQR